MAYPKHIQHLVELFSVLPGIGPRQAVRLAYALREKDPTFLASLSKTISSLKKETAQCTQCWRVTEQHISKLCDICRSETRDGHSILIIEKDSDLEAFERGDRYKGTYHVLGGTISAFDKTPGETLHLRELFERIKQSPYKNTLEVIIATSNTLEGNQTGNYIEKILEPLKIVLSRLGRGLSTGSEIEYADPLTLEQALKNRK